jgi:hypothetical protein
VAVQERIMQITLNIPDALAPLLRTAHGDDLGRAALERLALEGYNAGALSRYQVQQLLGFTNRWDTEEWLGRHQATVQYSLDDLEADRKTLDRLLGPVKP